MNLTYDDWSNICQRVTDIASPMFKIEFPVRVKSSMLSALFEIEAAKYYTDKGIEVRNAQNDHEPDLYFVEEKIPLEIKVTKKAKYNKFRGNKVSKKDSHYVLIIWDEPFSGILNFEVIHSYLKKDDWGKDCPNYNASFLSVKNLKESSKIVSGAFVCKSVIE